VKYDGRWKISRLFSFSELAGIISGGRALLNQRVIKRLVDSGVIVSVQKGIYVTKDYDLFVLAMRIDERSYVSMNLAPAFYGKVGAVPVRALSVVHTGREKSFSTPFGEIK